MAVYKDSGLDWRSVLECDFKEQDGGVKWIYVGQDSVKWRAVVSAVMNLRVVP